MSLMMMLVNCASNSSHNKGASLTPLNDKYGKPRVSPRAKKALKGDLAKREENKVVCRKVKKTGSSIPVVSCKTIAEHKSDQKRSKDAAERIIYDAHKNTGRFGDN